MAKKILFESTIHQLAYAAKRLSHALELNRPAVAEAVRSFAKSWNFTHVGGSKCVITWTYPSEGESSINLKSATFYKRGDDQQFAIAQKESGQVFAPDAVQSDNQKLFDDLLLELLRESGILGAHKIEVEAVKAESAV
jgi:hypothetical protein